jgi:hypothetical protein
MASVPPPSTIPETPPMDPGGMPDEVTTPAPDIDIPDPGGPGDPGENPPQDEAEAHPS